MNNKNFVVNSSSKEMFYDANEGFIKGNIQKNIYDMYKDYIRIKKLLFKAISRCSATLPRKIWPINAWI